MEVAFKQQWIIRFPINFFNDRIASVADEGAVNEFLRAVLVWAVYPLPFAYIYFETCEPESHKSLFQNKICAVYLSFNWLKWTYNIGFYKPIN
jgi:hypothetical protein